MRRREEGLGYWLSVASDARQPTLLTSFRRMVQRRLTAGRLRSLVGDFPAGMDPQVHSQGVTMSGVVPIRDGLAYLEPAGERGSLPGGIAAYDVRSTVLVTPAAAISLRLPGDISLRVNSLSWIRFPSLKLIPGIYWERPTRVRTMPCFAMPGTALSFSQWLDSGRTVVRADLARIAALQQGGHSLDVREMRDAERESFLREASALRGIQPGGSELLAVFRNVPIEIVSRLSYSRDKQMIFYSLTLNPRLRRTRVHDVAAVRDLTTGEIYLIPHRARYRTVFFN